MTTPEAELGERLAGGREQPFLDFAVDADAEHLIWDLIFEIGPDRIAGLPAIIFRQPDLAPVTIATNLRALRNLLLPQQYAFLKQELLQRAHGTSPYRESRRLQETNRRQMVARQQAEKQQRDMRAAEERRAAEIAMVAEDARVAAERKQRLAEKQAAAARGEAERTLRAEREQQERQLRLREEEQRARRAQGALAEFERALASSLVVTQRDLDALLPREEQWVLRERIRSHVRDWFAARSDRLDGRMPDDAQLDVICHVDGDLLVQARAGSGKTRALTYRAMFLMEACGVLPDEILLLAFNRKAAQEIASRLEAMRCAIPHVMTFHALGMAINRPVADVVTDDEDDQGYSQIRSRLATITRQLETSPRFSQEMRDVLLAIRRGKGKDAPSGANAFVALNGSVTDSYEAALLVDFLFEHGLNANVRYMKAAALSDDIVVGAAFTIAKQEYHVSVGGTASGPEEASKSGDDDAPIRLTVTEVTRGMDRAGMFAKWRAEMRVAGHTLRPLSEEEVWARAHEHLRREFIKLVSSYVMRMRSQGRNGDARRAWVRDYRTDIDCEKRFIDLAERVYQTYEKLMADGRFVDFQEVIVRAAAAVEAGKTTWRRGNRNGELTRLRHLMVDEFQDVSPLFMRLIKALRARSRGMALMGVGDDWQAINGFAGATTRYFEQFERMFAGATRRSLPTNYRSLPAIVMAGNDIMDGYGEPSLSVEAVGGEVLHADLEAFRPDDEEVRRFSGRRLVPALRRLVAVSARSGATVTLLSRTREPVPGRGGKWVDDCKGGLPWEAAERVSGSSVHRFKGMEADVAILVDASDRSFPTIPMSWFLFRVFGDTIESLIDDERRLLYVAATRAAKTLICVTGSRAEKTLSSLFGVAGNRFTPVGWANYPAPSHDGLRTCSVVVTSLQARGLSGAGTKPVKEQLIAARFRYLTNGGPHWVRSETLTAEGGVEVICENLRTESWATEGDGLLVQLMGGPDEALATFSVLGGTWTRMQ